MDKSQLVILIIEDDLIIAENLKENLEEIGYGSIYIASSSIVALELFTKTNPDLCLVDIQLNGSPMDGIATILAGNMNKICPIVYLTSFVDEATRERAKRTNPGAYLVKPANKIQIDIAIDMALNTFYNKVQPSKAPIYPLISGPDFIFLKIRNKDYERYEKFHYNDISYFKSDGSYTEVHSCEKSPLISYNLKKTLELVNHPIYIRCHRSYAVNLHHIQSFDVNHLYVANGNELLNIPIGDQYRVDLMLKITRI